MDANRLLCRGASSPFYPGHGTHSVHSSCMHCAVLQIAKYSGEKMSFTKVFTTKKHQEAKLGEGGLSSFA